MKKKGGLIAVSKHINNRYHVHIIMRGFHGQTSDDYHATVTRLSDDIQLIFISDWKWVLGWKIRPWALNRAFKYYDKHQKKLAKVEDWVI